MENQIPAGTKVQVELTSKGVTALRDAVVQAHGNGVVHVDVDGESLSVHPLQVFVPDAPADPADTAAPADAISNDSIPALVNVLAASVNDLLDRVTKLEQDFLDLQARVTAALTPAPAVADLPISTEQNSITPPAPAEPAGDDSNSNPDGAADADG